MTQRLLTAAIFVIAGGAATAAVWAGSASTVTLPYYGSRDLTPSWTGTTHHLGHFSLVTQTGEPWTDADVAGRVHVASFIYTRCSGICPTLVSQLKRVQARIGDPRFVVVSYSVTPEVDPPAVLAAFGAARGIDPRHWKLVTGDRDQIYGLARDGYFAGDERLARALSDPGAFLHTEQIVLVDATGRLRGVYDGTQSADVDHLIEDAGVLLAGR